MAITVTTIDRPVLQVELQEGGDLVAETTYYFVGVFVEWPWTFYNMGAQSPASEQVSITTTTTHKQIKMTWVAPNVTSSLKIKWDTATLLNPDGSYIITPGSKWNSTYISRGWTGTEKIINSADLLTNATSHHVANNGEIASTIEMPLALDYSIGRPYVTITGSESYTNFVNTIKASAIANVFQWYVNGFMCYCNFTGTGTITFSKLNIIIIGKTDGANFTFTESVLNYSFATLYISLYGIYNRSTVIGHLVGNYCTANKLTIFNGSIQNLWNAIFTAGYNRMRYFPVDTIAENNDHYSAYMTIESSDSFVGKNMRFYNQGTTVVADIRAVTTAAQPANPVPYRFYDSYTDRTGGYVIVSNQYLNTTSYPRNLLLSFDFYATVNIRVSDENDNVINDAVITITDKDGTVYTDPTDIMLYYERFATDTSIYATIYDLNPFTIKIEKAGYQTYNDVFNTTEKIDWEIALTPDPETTGIKIADSLAINAANGKLIMLI